MTDRVAHVRELIQQGRFTSAVHECDLALAGDMPCLERARLLQFKAQALASEDHRWGGPAFGCLREALTLAEGDPVELARIHCAFTAAHASNGNARACREHRTAFVQLWRSEPELEQSASIAAMYAHAEYNLGLALHESERMDEAEDAYLMALDAYKKLQDPAFSPLIAEIKHNLVDVFQELGWHRRAKSLLDEIDEWIPEAKYGAQKRNRKALYALHKEDFSAALLWVESGLGHPSCDTKTRAALTLTKAKIAQSSGHLISAHDCALEAMRLAALAENSRISHRVCHFLRDLKGGGRL